MDINITPKKIALVLILFIPFAIFILDDSAGLGNIILTINNYQSDMNGEIQLNIDYTLTLEDQGFPSVPPIELDETGSAKIAVSKLFYWSDEQSKYVPYGNGDIYLITNEGEYTISLTNDDFYEYELIIELEDIGDITMEESESESDDYVSQSSYTPPSSTYPYYRFEYTDIKYRFNTDCPWEWRKDIDKAFKIIEKDTNKLLSFIETTNNDANFNIYCYDYTNEFDEGWLTLGEAIPDDIYEENKIIINSSLYFYASKYAVAQCPKYPDTEIHEILHAFNFDHVYNTSKIMDGTGDRKYCTELDDDTRNCLISIYDGSNDNCANVPFIY